MVLYNCKVYLKKEVFKMTEEITKENYKEVLEGLWNKRWGDKDGAATECDGKIFYFVDDDQKVDDNGNPYLDAIKSDKIYQLTYAYPDGWEEMSEQDQLQSWDEIDWDHAVDAEQLTDDLDETLLMLNDIADRW